MATGAGCKVVAIGLAVVAVGLPINDLFSYALVLTAAILVATGRMVKDWRRWLGACALAAMAMAAHVLLPAPHIEDGHNAFLVDGPGELERALPADAFRQMLARFDAAYPAERRCARNTTLCWRPTGIPQRPFAFSADGILDRGPLSRRVTGIDFSDPAGARLGFVNESAVGWPHDANEVVRFERDKEITRHFSRFHVTLPLFVMYRFPADFVGSALCWRGLVLWEGQGERFSAENHSTMACRALQGDDVGRRIFGVSIKPDSLAMSLDPTATILLRRAIPALVMLFAIGGILALLVRFCARRALLALALTVGALLVVAAVDPQFIGGFRPLDGGDDGLVYEGFGRGIVRDLLAGNISAALAGGEPVYYFTPGMRYVRALELFVFGETFLGYLSAMLALPFLVFAAGRRLLPLPWALAFVVLFVATPLGYLFGSSYLLYIKAAARGYADAMGFFFFLAGFVLLVPTAGKDKTATHAFFAALLFAAAVFTRPNLVLAAGVMLAGAVLFALRAGRWRKAAAICLGFAPILLSPLHNWVFGHRLIPFSDNVVQPLTMRMLPQDYLTALLELAHLNFAGEHVGRAIRQLSEWLAGASELLVMVPLHAAAVVILLRVGLWGARFDRWLRLTALATLVQHGIGATYTNASRYHLLTWLLTCLVSLAWLHGEGLAWLDRRHAGWRERCARPVVIARLAAALARLQRAYGPHNRSHESPLAVKSDAP